MARHTQYLSRCLVTLFSTGWLVGLPLPASAAEMDEQLTLGKQLFLIGTTPTCAVCHTLSDAKAEGPVGPDFDEIKPSEEQVVKAVRGGIGLMPSYKDKLSDQQIAAIARYVSKASGGAP